MRTITSLILLLSVITLPAQTAQELFDSGVAKYKKQDLAGAIQDYNKAIQLNPDYAGHTTIVDWLKLDYKTLQAPCRITAKPSS